MKEHTIFQIGAWHAILIWMVFAFASGVFTGSPDRTAADEGCITDTECMDMWGGDGYDD